MSASISVVQVSPEEYFAAYVSDAAGFGDAESVQRGAVLMAAAEVGVEPSVRQHVRDLFWVSASSEAEHAPACPAPDVGEC